MTIEIINLFKELDKLKKEMSEEELVKDERFIKLRNIIAEKNLKFVRYRVQHIIGSQSEDLIEAGNEGLLIAILKYDISKGTEFSTYAAYWIDQYIHREMIIISNHRKIPIQKYERVKAAITKLENLNQQVTPKSIAEEAEIDEQEALAILTSLSIVSLNYQPDDEDDMMQVIPNEELPVEEQVQSKLVSEELLELLRNELNETQYEVITLRYGLSDGRCSSLEEIARIFHVTRERIRQIEYKALRILRKSKKIEKFAVYMDKPDDYKKNK